MTIYRLRDFLSRSSPLETKLLCFPDGQDRLVTLSQRDWQSLDEMLVVEYMEIYDIIAGAVEIGEEFPIDDKSLSVEVELLIRAFYRMFRHERGDHANDLDESRLRQAQH